MVSHVFYRVFDSSILEGRASRVFHRISDSIPWRPMCIACFLASMLFESKGPVCFIEKSLGVKQPGTIFCVFCGGFGVMVIASRVFYRVFVGCKTAGHSVPCVLS